MYLAYLLEHKTNVKITEVRPITCHVPGLYHPEQPPSPVSPDPPVLRGCQFWTLDAARRTAGLAAVASVTGRRVRAAEPWGLLCTLGRARRGAAFVQSRGCLPGLRALSLRRSRSARPPGQPTSGPPAPGAPSTDPVCLSSPTGLGPAPTLHRCLDASRFLVYGRKASQVTPAPSWVCTDDSTLGFLEASLSPLVIRTCTSAGQQSQGLGRVQVNV